MTTPFPAFPQGGRRSFPPCLAPPKRLREGEGGNKKGGKIRLKIMKIRKELYSRITKCLKKEHKGRNSIWMTFSTPY